MRTRATGGGAWLRTCSRVGRMGMGRVELAMVQAEAARAVGSFAINAQAPDEGNMHTLLHWGTEAKKRCPPTSLPGGRAVVLRHDRARGGGSTPVIRTRAYPDGDEWVVNGHKWFISGANGARFAILICRTEDDPEMPKAANTAFIVDLPAEGWNQVREIETWHGPHGHAEIVIEDLRIHDDQMLGGRGLGHMLGQLPARPRPPGHCLQLDRAGRDGPRHEVDRSLKRFSHGSCGREAGDPVDDSPTRRWTSTSRS